METLHIELDIEVEETLTKISGQSPKDLKEELTQRIQQWVKQYLQSLQTGDREDPWLDFVNDIDKYAVDTGIEDFSINHEHYLYGGPKRQ